LQPNRTVSGFEAESDELIYGATFGARRHACA